MAEAHENSKANTKSRAKTKQKATGGTERLSPREENSGAIPVEQQDSTVEPVEIKAPSKIWGQDFSIKRTFAYEGDTEVHTPKTHVNRPDRAGEFAVFEWIPRWNMGDFKVPWSPVKADRIARSKEEGDSKGLPYVIGPWLQNSEGNVYYPDGVPRANEVEARQLVLCVAHKSDVEGLYKGYVSKMEAQFDRGATDGYTLGDETFIGHGQDEYEGYNPDSERYGLGEVGIEINEQDRNTLINGE